jgi:hypothetical protein
LEVDQERLRLSCPDHERAHIYNRDEHAWRIDDVVATAGNIVGSELLYRLGIVSNFVMMIAWLFIRDVPLQTASAVHPRRSA